MSNLIKNEKLILITAISLLFSLIFFSIAFPEFAINTASSILATIIAFISGWLFQLFLNEKNKPVIIWGSRDQVNPRFRKRLNELEKNLFMIGMSFESTFNNYKEPLKEALKKNIKVKILLLDPFSQHVDAHQPFSDRNLRAAILETINGRLKKLYDDLSESERKNIEVKTTEYLPRFSANIWDGSKMFLNFYLYESKANNNPVIELKKKKNKKEFDAILNSLNSLFDVGSNRSIISNGKWIEIKE